MPIQERSLTFSPEVILYWNEGLTIAPQISYIRRSELCTGTQREYMLWFRMSFIAVVALSLLTNLTGVFAVSGVTTFNDVSSYLQPVLQVDNTTLSSSTLRAVLPVQVCIYLVFMLISINDRDIGFPPNNSQGNGIFAAAMSDLSPLWIGARCQGTQDASKCDGRGSCVNCIGRKSPL